MAIRTEEQIRNEILSSSQARSEANYFGAGSVLFNLATDVARLVRDIETRQEDIANSIHISSATTSQIQAYARDMNLPVVQAKRAYTLASDRNIVLSTIDGTPISRTLTANNITLEGLPIFNATRSVRYIITSYLGSLESNQIFVGANCAFLGIGGNVDVNQLINFERSYDNLIVKNLMPINTGISEEIPEITRERILLKTDYNLENLQALNSILSSLPGIGKSSIFDGYFGPGSLLICIQPSNGILFPLSYLREIEAKIGSVIKTGLKVKVTNFNLIPVIINARVILSNNTNAEGVVRSISNFITNYFNTIPGGQSLNLADLEASIIFNIPGISLVGVNNHFEKVTYSITDGSTSINYVADPGGVISANQSELITLEALNIYYE